MHRVIGPLSPQTYCRAALIGCALLGVTQAVQAGNITAQDYEAASKLLDLNLSGLVRNQALDPHWIGAAGRFWYRREGEHGPEFMVVTSKGKRASAFNHKGIAHALAGLLGSTVGSDEYLPESLRNAELDQGLATLIGNIGNKRLECQTRLLKCRWLESETADPTLLRSPDGHEALFTLKNNLWIRDLRSGQERSLTSDGTPLNSWAKLPDDSFTALAQARSGVGTPPAETYWSPDGRYVITERTDERDVETLPFVEWVPHDGSLRPIVHSPHAGFPGDRGELKVGYYLIELATNRVTPIDIPSSYEPIWEISHGGLVYGWSIQHKQAFILVRGYGWKKLALLRLNLETGALDPVIEEATQTRLETNTVWYNQPNFRLLGDGREAIWYSDRSGSGQLYLYDAQSGRLKNSITTGAGVVVDIERVDEQRREVYFTAVGREAGADPYYRQLYRASLDAHLPIRLLTDPNSDHQFEPAQAPLLARVRPAPLKESHVQSEAGVFIDTWSTVDKPPVSQLRSARDGRLIAELEHADASRLYERGWQPPVRERLKAADGVTDIMADYYPPLRAQTGLPAPVIDAAYGGPQVVVAPYNFARAYQPSNGRGVASLARLGFAVVIIDGRSTPMRSRAFRDAGYPEFTQIGVEDHIAAIRQLVQRHPELDPDRIGVYGWSWGGTFAAQAILSHPDFYKVAVSGAGVYDYAADYLGSEPYLGIARYADGTHYRTRPDEEPENWAAEDVTKMASRLTGHLLIIYGDMDENAPPVQAFRLVDALTRAEKTYDLIYLPNRSHSGSTDLYTIKRTWDYFVEHLLGEPPPDNATVLINDQR
jgi:dipeptidyl-peptidase-4